MKHAAYASNCSSAHQQPVKGQACTQGQLTTEGSQWMCRKLVATFLEANGRGYWDANPDQIEKLRQLYTDVEDRIEGV